MCACMHVLCIYKYKYRYEYNYININLYNYMQAICTCTRGLIPFHSMATYRSLTGFNVWNNNTNNRYITQSFGSNSVRWELVSTLFFSSVRQKGTIPWWVEITKQLHMGSSKWSLGGCIATTAASCSRSSGMWRNDFLPPTSPPSAGRCWAGPSPCWG